MRTKAILCLVGLLVASSVLADDKTKMLDVGDKAPNFSAKGVDGKTIALSDLKGAKAVVLCFTCNKCPVAVAYEDRFIEFNKQYKDKDVKFVAINVNTTENLMEMKKRAEAKNFNFPYAYDGSGKSAKAYGARVTPHMFVIDADGIVAYIGSFDDKKNAKAAEKQFVADAVNAILKGKKPEVSKTKAFGCTIKRKPKKSKIK